MCAERCRRPLGTGTTFPYDSMHYNYITTPSYILSKTFVKALIIFHFETIFAPEIV